MGRADAPRRQSAWMRTLRLSLLVVSVVVAMLTVPGHVAAQADRKLRIPRKAARELADRVAFEKYAYRAPNAGVLAELEVKLLITDVGVRELLWFFNAGYYESHFEFARKGLRHKLGIREFEAVTYFTTKREYLSATLIRHEIGDKKFIYALEFWPADPVSAKDIITTFRLVAKRAPFLANDLRYHPRGVTQQQLWQEYKDELDAAQVPVIGTEDLYAQHTVTPMNIGVAVGTLRILDGKSVADRPPTNRDIVVYRTIPNDIGHVAGIVTNQPQTPLSHVNLLARQNRIPNCFVRDATKKLRRLDGKIVRYEVTAAGYTIGEVDADSAKAFWAKHRPPSPVVPERDLSQQKILNLSKIKFSDRHAFGAKTAHLAALGQAELDCHVPSGYGIPFWYYDEFMKENGLYKRAEAMLKDTAFRHSSKIRETRLAGFRKAIRKAPVPKRLSFYIDKLPAGFGKRHALRCRSSTNNEDLVGFNGAGLYESRTHRADEGPLTNTVRQVWAGLWTLRAFDEREYHRVDHLKTAMGVLVHLNYDDERANGVIVTRNLTRPNFDGIYVNVQAGEVDSVTNPNGATPEVFCVSQVGRSNATEVIYLQRSSLKKAGERVLTSSQIAALYKAAVQAHDELVRVYESVTRPGAFDDAAFDIEFKIDSRGYLAFKQARPMG